MTQYKLDYGDDVCPICENKTLIRGDTVDFTQVDPDHCEWCGYLQPRDKRQAKELSHLTKCWELQVDPWNRGN